jgi:hypothetical protein
MLIAFVMKVVGEFVHEVVGHGLLVVYFGGQIVSAKISLLWPYELSNIVWSGNFQSWQMAWIYGGGILACLIVSSLLQAFILFSSIKNRWLLAFLFWLSFWTFINPVGYLIIGGIIPIGDVSQLIIKGVLTKVSSLVLGVASFTIFFFSISKIFKKLLLSIEVMNEIKDLRLFFVLFWLIIPLVTLTAMAGLELLNNYAIYFLISFSPSILAYLLPENLYRRL